MLQRDVYCEGGAGARNTILLTQKNGSAIALAIMEMNGFDTLAGDSIFPRSVYVLLARLRLAYTAHLKPHL